MRIETVKTWILVGLLPPDYWNVAFLFEVTEGGKFLIVIGLIYFGIGAFMIDT